SECSILRFSIERSLSKTAFRNAGAAKNQVGFRSWHHSVISSARCLFGSATLLPTSNGASSESLNPSAVWIGKTHALRSFVDMPCQVRIFSATSNKLACVTRTCFGVPVDPDDVWMTATDRLDGTPDLRRSDTMLTTDFKRISPRRAAAFDT